jgi:type II secretory pathway predicted ATPase ExeA
MDIDSRSVRAARERIFLCCAQFNREALQASDPSPRQPEARLDVIESKSRPEMFVKPTRWTHHWGLDFDPFLGSPTRYVALSEHEKAIARLSGLVEAGQPLGLLSGESGLGKSTILEQLRRRSRTPGRRIALVSNPIDGADLVASLATALGSLGDWRSLQAAVRVLAWQRVQLIVLVDECRDLLKSAGLADLKRLVNLGAGGEPRITLIVATENESAIHDQPELRDALSARLKRLTRTDAADYLSSKLQAAGREDEAFTPKALTRIHAAGEGIPRTLDRLASLSLMAGASLGLEMISPDVVDGISQELSPYRR